MNETNIGTSAGELEALESFKQASSVRPEQWIAYPLLGDAYSRLGSYDKAVAALGESIRLMENPNGSDPKLSSSIVRRPGNSIRDAIHDICELFKLIALISGEFQNHAVLKLKELEEIGPAGLTAKVEAAKAADNAPAAGGRGKGKKGKTGKKGKDGKGGKGGKGGNGGKKGGGQGRTGPGFKYIPTHALKIDSMCIGTKVQGKEFLLAGDLYPDRPMTFWENMQPPKGSWPAVDLPVEQVERETLPFLALPLSVCQRLMPLLAVLQLTDWFKKPLFADSSKALKTAQDLKKVFPETLFPGGAVLTAVTNALLASDLENPIEGIFPECDSFDGIVKTTIDSLHESRSLGYHRLMRYIHGSFRSRHFARGRKPGVHLHRLHCTLSLRSLRRRSARFRLASVPATSTRRAHAEGRWTCASLGGTRERRTTASPACLRRYAWSRASTGVVCVLHGLSTRCFRAGARRSRRARRASE